MSYQWEPPDILGPIMRGLQIRAYIEDIKARREARAQQAELQRAALQEHQQTQAMRKFQLMRDMADQGWLPAQPGDTGQNDEAIAQAIGGISPENRRPVVETPFGTYRAPSETDRFERARRRATQEGILKGEEQKAAEGVTNPYEEVSLPEELGGGTAQVPRKSKVDALIKIEGALQKRHPNLSISYSDDQSGNRTYFGTDPRTGEVKPLKTFPGVAKPQVVSPNGRTANTGISSRALSALQKAQEKIDEATNAYGKGENDLRTPEERWTEARNAVNQAATAFPDELEAGQGTGGYPYIKAKSKQARGVTTSSGPSAILPRANVTAAAKRKGMSVPDFLKWFESNGGIVQ